MSEREEGEKWERGTRTVSLGVMVWGGAGEEGSEGRNSRNEDGIGWRDGK